MKVLVTGGMGYIGSHTVVELYNAGFEPIILDDLSNSTITTLDGLQKIVGDRPVFYQCDLKDRQELKNIFAQESFGAVIHFAASKAVGESVENPLLYYKNNVLSTINLLELMLEFGVDSLIFSSSCTVYGEPEVLPVTERAPIMPATSPYGNTKQIGEEIIQDTLLPNKQLKAISLRYFNPIGAHDSAFIGELPQEVPNNLLPYLIKVATGELRELSVFGNDYGTSDGTCVRDYIHVVDLAHAHVMALQRLIDGKNRSSFEVFNLGTGEGYSVLDIIKTFEKATGRKVRYKISKRRPGDIEKTYADTRFAHEELQWKGTRDLANMLLSAWKWHQHFVTQ